MYHVKKYFLIQVSYAFIYGIHLMVSKKMENMCACYTSEMKRTIIIYEVNLSIKNMLRYVSLWLYFLKIEFHCTLFTVYLMLQVSILELMDKLNVGWTKVS